MISNLKLNQFRNFHEFSLTDFDQSFNVIAAPNGRGKSNLLESIYFLATGFSARTNRSAEAIQWGQSSARIEGRVNQVNLSVVIGKGYKKFLQDGKTVEFPQFLPHLHAVIFQPTDLNLLNGQPSLRRRFLNRLVAQINFEYLYALVEYQKLLHQRNVLLKHESIDSNLLAVIEERILPAASLIFQERHTVINLLNDLLRSYQMRIEYLPSPRSLTSLDAVAVNSAGIVQEIMREKYKSLREKERHLGFSLIGPQRDDFIVYSQDQQSPHGFKALGTYGSRAQQRMGIVNLKLAESKVVTQKTEMQPVLLLDDVLSELDNFNRQKIFADLENFQIFLTTTDEKSIPANSPHFSRIEIDCGF